MATNYDDRSLGDGLTLSTARLLQVAIVAAGGLEFVSGELSIKYPADGGVKTSSVGLEVDIAGMASQSDAADADLLLIEDVTGDNKVKMTIAEMRKEMEQPSTVRTVTGTATALVTDRVIVCNSASAFTVTLPAAADLTGVMLDIKNKNTGIVTVDGASAETIDDMANQTISKYDSITVVSDGSEWWII
jgi:hypothetical protein